MGRITFSDKKKYKGTTETISGGEIKNGIIKIWKSSQRKEWYFTLTLEETEKAMKKYANTLYSIHELCKNKVEETNLAWIENTKDPILTYDVMFIRR